MRIFGGLLLLLALSGWSAWFVICNVYEFAPALDPWALAGGWLIALLAATQAWRVGNRARWGWGMCGLAASIGLYLLLIHRGVGQGVALLVLLGASAIVMVAAGRGSAAGQVRADRGKTPAARAGDAQPEQ